MIYTLLDNRIHMKYILLLIVLIKFFHIIQYFRN